MSSNQSIYVEIFIASAIDDVWTKTQIPDLHQQWDLRFTKIEYLSRSENSAPQQFSYETRLSFGLRIRGTGETVGNHDALQGKRSSALKFWSDDWKSLIRTGSGYWQYIPEKDGVRFLTWYDYETRFGILGSLFVDRAIFRPMIGWATAWSFDRLRLWIEKGIVPAAAFRSSLVHALARFTLAFIWVYQGLVPKLLSTNRDELVMLNHLSASSPQALRLLPLVGAAEVIFGLVILLTWRYRWLFPLNIGFGVLATVVVGLTSPEYLSTAFNPITLNASVIALALIGFVASFDTPFASKCRRKPRKEGA